MCRLPTPAKTDRSGAAEEVDAPQRGASRKPEDGLLLAVGGVVAADEARVWASSGRDRRDDDAAVVRCDEVRVTREASRMRVHERCERRVGKAVRICSDIPRIARAGIRRQGILEAMPPRALRLRGLELGSRGSVKRAQVCAGEPSDGAEQRERELAALLRSPAFDLRDAAVEEGHAGAAVGEQRERLLRPRTDRCLEVAS